MEQLIQYLKDGKMQLLEVPFPALQSGCVLVRNHYSLISAGTEGKTVKDARLSYIGKARARKDEVKKVVDAAKTFGLLNTYNMVMNKLDAPSSLGYSCAGEVIAVADNVSGFQVGDRVACGGAGAVHAEVVSVSENLCVKIPDAVNEQSAAFTTLASIALQGVRQADLRLAENCVVIGLGLVGQLTIQFLKAAGIKTIGIDIDEKMVALALQSGADVAINRNREDLEQIISAETNGFGADAVIITAGTSSTDPVDLAGALCRQKGKVIIVGAVPTGFKRPNYFKKELDLRMSCSYGPGRYDMDYEELGLDYPIGYVRWTENRNMQAYVALVNDKKINTEPLITHVFDFKDAEKAYDLILNRTEPFVGVLLKYDVSKKLTNKVSFTSKSFSSSKANVGLIGAGSFGQNFLLPAMKGHCNFTGVATARANNSRNIADKYGFNYCTGNAAEIFSDTKTDTVFIATRHDSHAAYVIEGLKNGKNIFVEKPLCMNEAQLEEIKQLYEKNGKHLMVGFNRRFAPLVKKLKETFNGDYPKAINYRINAGFIPSEHWIHDKTIGGGRIIGEVCHFIDLCSFIAGSKITSVAAQVLNTSPNLNDTVAINLSFANGSIASISYFSNGNKNLSKEYLEVFGSGIATVLDDFKELKIYGREERSHKSAQDKGHKTEVAEFLKAVKSGGPTPIPFEQTYSSTLATFKVLESIALNGAAVK